MRTHLTLLISFAFAGIAFAGDQVPMVSFSEFLPWGTAYNGKAIRLHGMIIGCKRSYCGLCPDWNGEASGGAQQRCLDVQWNDWQGTKQLDELATVSEVTISGTYKSYEPHPIVLDMEVDWICSRDCSELGKIIDARIDELKRSPVTSLPDAIRGDLLRAPAGSDEAEIRASLKTATEPDVSWDNDDTRIYTTDRWPWAYACHWDFPDVPTAERHWPVRYGDLGGTRSLADPYTCWQVDRIRGWKIHPRPVHEE